MLVSLVVATKARVHEVDRLLNSVARQTYSNFEVIVVDQNQDERLSPVLERYQEKINLKWIRAKDLGVSFARNTGLQHAKGELVTFPDDDCWYPQDLLERVVAFFQSHPHFAGLTGRVLHINGQSVIGRWDKVEGEINRFNEWTRSIEFAIFARTSAIRSVGGFDTSLGPGAGTPWGANEGDDLILRALSMGYRFYYTPRIGVFHPGPCKQFDESLLNKARAYGRGMGYVMRKHRFPTWFFAYWCVRSLGGLVWAALRKDWSKCNYYWATLKGRLEGWMGNDG